MGPGKRDGSSRDGRDEGDELLDRLRQLGDSLGALEAVTNRWVEVMGDFAARINASRDRDAQRGDRAATGFRQAAAAPQDAENTQTASVHRAVLESATKLQERYQSEISISGLDHVIARIKSSVSSLPEACAKPEDSEKHKAAKRCIARLTSDRAFMSSFTLSQDLGITGKKLLALAFLAASDASFITSTPHDARKQFINALYEIQRGNNLSASGADLGGPDSSICSTGTVNKFIEMLHGIHPDCQIRYVTKATAALKLPIVVREQADIHLARLACPESVDQLYSFTRLMAQLPDEGVAPIWGDIKASVARHMFGEFGSLYSGPGDRDFREFIETGLYTDLNEIDKFKFQASVQNSEGYRKYCAPIVRDLIEQAKPRRSSGGACHNVGSDARAFQSRPEPLEACAGAGCAPPRERPSPMIFSAKYFIDESGCLHSQTADPS